MILEKPSHVRGSLSRANWRKKSGDFLLFFILEAAVFALLPLSERLPITPLLYAHGGFTAACLIAAILLRQSDRGREYWPVLYVLFVAGTAVLISTLFGDILLRLFRLTVATPPGIAVAKLTESLWRGATILALMALIGADWRSMHLTRGRLGLGLAVGAAGFVALAALAFLPLASQPGMVTKLLSLSPWIALFVLANGFGEELLYRGILLKRYQSILGKGRSNLLTAIVFTLVHVQVTYVGDLLQFLLIVFPLALIWGYLMQKTDSLWGSALFHAGADCVIILGIFASI